MSSNQDRKRASTSSNDTFEDVLASVSASLLIQRKIGRRQLLHSSTSKNGDGFLEDKIIKMVSAVTQVNEPSSREHREVVLWTRDSIEKFTEHMIQKSRERQGGLPSLPPDVAADALTLISKLSNLLE